MAILSNGVEVKSYAKGSDIKIDVSVTPPTEVPDLDLQNCVISFLATTNNASFIVANCATNTTAGAGEASITKSTNLSNLQLARVTIPGTKTAEAFTQGGSVVLYEVTVVSAAGDRYRGLDYSGQFTLNR